MAEPSKLREIPQGYTFRPVERTDFSNRYIETLKVLTTVGEISAESFDEVFSHWSSLPDIYQPHVITNAQGVVVATGMLFIERKIVHQCGKVGHIEDIAVASNEQGKNLGRAMICRLTDVAEKAGCYKVILDCAHRNVGFYKKCGYNDSGVEMSKRFKE